MEKVIITLCTLLAFACATDQIKINPDLQPGESVGVDVTSCFSDEALESKWGFGIPKWWNVMNGCPLTEEEADAVAEELKDLELPPEE